MMGGGAGEERALCSICLSPVSEEQVVGSTEVCKHLFCYTCLHIWSQTSNTCPVDRLPFSFILQRGGGGGDVQREIRVESTREEDDDEAFWRLEDEISDGELADLLADMEEAPPTSRLRPASTNPPTTFRERRRSVRIQNQNQNPEPESRTRTRTRIQNQNQNPEGPPPQPESSTPNLPLGSPS